MKKKPLILLVEDELLVAMDEQMTLENAGYRVILAKNGEKAIEIVNRQSDIRMVLMDIDLGAGIDGSETASRILKHHDLPIMFLSGHTEPNVVNRTEEITSYGYIVKNSGDTVLLASIRMGFRLFEARKSAKDLSKIQETILLVGQELIAEVNMEHILQTASDNLSKISGLDTGAIYLLEEDHLILEAATPKIPKDFPDEFLRAPCKDHPHIMRAITSCQSVLVADTHHEDFTSAEVAIVKSRNLKTILYVPLLSRGRKMGVFIAGSVKKPIAVSEHVIDLCSTLANMAAIALDNSRLLMESNQ